MAFKKNGPGCCCGGQCSCTGGGGDFGFRITLSGTPVDLGVNCAAIPQGCGTFPAITYTPNHEFDCLDANILTAYPYYQSPSTGNQCGTCFGSFLGLAIHQQISLQVGVSKHPITQIAYDGIIAVLKGAYANTSGTTPCTSACFDQTEIEYRFPYTYNSGESGYGNPSGANNCPIGFGSVTGSIIQTATDNAIDVTAMSISITYISGLVP